MVRQNPRDNSRADAERAISRRGFLAVVADTDGGLIKIRRLRQAQPDDQFYFAYEGVAASVSPGDLVDCVVRGGTIIVAGKIVTS